MQYDRTVLAYHGCDRAVAERVLAGEAFVPSANTWDWLGRGIYFWEFGPDRALRFAREQQRRGKLQEPAVVGALLQLGRCYDLLDTHYTADLAASFLTWKSLITSARLPLPANAGAPPDRKLRRLDCAVLNWTLDELDRKGHAYDSVRGGFVEGKPVYPGSGIHEEMHIQIAVRNPRCILGVFRPTLSRGPR